MVRYSVKTFAMEYHWTQIFSFQICGLRFVFLINQELAVASKDSKPQLQTKWKQCSSWKCYAFILFIWLRCLVPDPTSGQQKQRTSNIGDWGQTLWFLAWCTSFLSRCAVTLNSNSCKNQRWSATADELNTGCFFSTEVGKGAPDAVEGSHSLSMVIGKPLSIRSSFVLCRRRFFSYTMDPLRTCGNAAGPIWRTKQNKFSLL